MAKKVIRLTETELKNIIKNIVSSLNEENTKKNKESYYLRNNQSWLGGDSSSNVDLDLDNDPDYEDDMDVYDVDTLFNKYPDVSKHYGRNMTPEKARIFHNEKNPVRVKRLRN
jgi:hypothetical protein